VTGLFDAAVSAPQNTVSRKQRPTVTEKLVRMALEEAARIIMPSGTRGLVTVVGLAEATLGVEARKGGPLLGT
jgi:electron transfer flavoprotein alpha/beta subunit